jgi:hypothetical protein
MADDDFGAIDVMNDGQRHGDTRRKPAPMPLWPTQIPYNLTRPRTRTPAVGCRRLAASTDAPRGIILSTTYFDTLQDDALYADILQQISRFFPVPDQSLTSQRMKVNG